MSMQEIWAAKRLIIFILTENKLVSAIYPLLYGKLSNKRFLNIELFHFAIITTHPWMEKGFMGLFES